MKPLSVSHPAVGRIAAALEASLDGMVAAAVEAIWEQVPAYRACEDDRLRDQVAGHVRAVFRAFLMWLAGGRAAQRADFTVTREQAARRVAQGISLADFLKAFRISQLTLWEGVRGAAGDDAGAREVALSAVHAGLLEVPEAYTEARAAREGLGGAAGVLALPMLTSFEYLVLREDETARRLIRPEVRQFVADDAAAGGTLIATLVEYAACDLNARTAAARLHLHVNTAYYRLERIAERTGCDLRRLADVVELLIAVRLLAAGPAPQPQPAARSPGTAARRIS